MVTLGMQLSHDGMQLDACVGAIPGQGPAEANAPVDEVEAPGDTATSSHRGRPKEKKTLWIGDLDRADCEVDESYVQSHMFYEFAHWIAGVRVCRSGGASGSFGFAEFKTHKAAEYVLLHLNGHYVPGRIHKYKLNWANFNLSDAKNDAAPPTSNPRGPNERDANAQDRERRNAGNSKYTKSTSSDTGNRPPGDTHSVWVGSLDPETTATDIEELFAEYYHSVCFVKVCTDPSSGTCRGFGFVHFREKSDAESALTEMNGTLCRGRRIRVNASHGSRTGNKGEKNDPHLRAAIQKLYEQTAAQAKAAAQTCGYVPTKRKHGGFHDGAANKLVIRNLDGNCPEQALTSHFAPFGEVVSVKVCYGGSKGYVTYADHRAAVNGQKYMNGAFIGSQRVTVDIAGTESLTNRGQSQDNPWTQAVHPVTNSGLQPAGMPKGVAPALVNGFLDQSLQVGQQAIPVACQGYACDGSVLGYGMTQIETFPTEFAFSTPETMEDLATATEPVTLSNGIDPGLLPADVDPELCQPSLLQPDVDRDLVEAVALFTPAMLQSSWEAEQEFNRRAIHDLCGKAGGKLPMDSQDLTLIYRTLESATDYEDGLVSMEYL